MNESQVKKYILQIINKVEIIKIKIKKNLT